MEIGVEHEANTTHRLYEASMRGCEATLNTLIQNDPLILHKVSLTSFSETPLHISTLFGHLDFTKALLSQRPELAKELDSSRRSPLHLASAEAHKEIVNELLLVNTDVCLVADQEGRIPLHLAAIRGRVEVIQELVSAKPDSVRVKLQEDTVLHLCVRYNHLDALKLLLPAAVNNEEFLNSKSHEGRTILQLSAILNQLETRRYLLLVPQIRVDVNSLIENGFVAFDASRNSLFPNNLQKVIDERVTDTRSTKSPKRPEVNSKKEAHPAVQTTNNLIKYLKYNNNWYEKTRGNLMVVATVIAAMSFQVATNPPGGFWDDNNSYQSCPNEKCKAGTPMNANTMEHTCNIFKLICRIIGLKGSHSFNEFSALSFSASDYQIFMVSSILSFSASLAIILLLISGVPLKNRISVGILAGVMWLTVIFLAISYYFSIKLLQVPDDKTFRLISDYYPKVWFWLLCTILLINSLQLCWWLLSKLVKGMIHTARCFCGLGKEPSKTAYKSQEQLMVV